MYALLGPLWWLWFVAPVFVVFAWILASKKDERRERELRSWRKNFRPDMVVGPADDATGYREKAKAHTARPKPPREVPALVGGLTRALRRVTEGDVVTHYELLPKAAYLSITGSNSVESSDAQVVVAKLDRRGPSFEVRPVPIIEGTTPPGLPSIEFKKDREFNEMFTVCGTDDDGESAATVKAIRRWLSEPIREALKDIPEVVLSVQGNSMALAWYGVADEEDLNMLVVAADTLFAEHGAEGGASLLGETDEDEDDEEEENEPAASPAKA